MKKHVKILVAVCFVLMIIFSVVELTVTYKDEKIISYKNSQILTEAESDSQKKVCIEFSVYSIHYKSIHEWDRGFNLAIDFIKLIKTLI